MQIPTTPKKHSQSSRVGFHCARVAAEGFKADNTEREKKERKKPTKPESRLQGAQHTAVISPYPPSAPATWRPEWETRGGPPLNG